MVSMQNRETADCLALNGVSSEPLEAQNSPWKRGRRVIRAKGNEYLQ